MSLPGTIPHLVTALLAGAAGCLLTLWMLGVTARTASQPGVDPVAGVVAPASLADAVSRSAPAVVSVFATAEGYRAPPSPVAPVAPGVLGPAPRERRETALGSGVILSADGLILTSRHLVKDAGKVRVVLADGRGFEVSLLGLDAETDLAVLRAPATGLPTAPIGDPAALRVGDLALAIGNPFGVGQTVTQGIVSALGRAELGITPIENFIQTDAAINPGNSGGALINGRGELVGINTAIFSETGSAAGVGFAIPADLALRVALGLAENGRVERGWLGVSGRSLTPELIRSFGLRAPHGVLVSSTQRDSPAERAGLRPGDVVTRVDEQDVTNVQELLDAIAGSGPNAAVSLEVWRGSERLRTSAVTDARPAAGD
jgi:serine protease DegS